MTPEEGALEDEKDSIYLAEGSAQKKQKSSKPKFKYIAKLWGLAAEGKHQKLTKLLQKHPELDVNAFNADGHTALHQVIEHLSTDIALVTLVKPRKARNLEGDT